jgi:hypothetical protein
MELFQIVVREFMSIKMVALPLVVQIYQIQLMGFILLQIQWVFQIL